MENKETIITALRTLFEPGDVFEIRILDAILPNSNWPHIQSGYFNYDHIETIPNLLANFKTYGGVYVTLNPVNPDLLARANNRFRKARSRETTSDEDILCRRWLLIDVDPVRPAGISATDAERNLSFDKAMEITSGLTSMGFPRPVCVNSGNGTQLLYHIDLKSEDEGLVQRCLQALQPCSTDNVHVDLSVHNAARICRLPGTWNRKGDPTDTRPHRIAEILDKPDKIEIVSTELLHKLAESIPETSIIPVHQSQPMKNDGKAISTGNLSSPIDDFNQRGNLTPILEKHGWQSVGETQENQLWRRPGKMSGNHSATFNGETFYVFSSNAAPFEAGRGYSRFGVYAMLEYNGDDTSAINALKAEGYGSNDNDVDISALLTQVGDQSIAVIESGCDDSPDSSDPSTTTVDPGLIPDDLLHVPGFIDQVMAYTLETAPYPNKPLAFTGALAMQAHLCGRKVRDENDVRPNIYLVALADSGTGKEYPRQVNMKIAYETGQCKNIGDSFASGEGIEDCMYLNQTMLFQTDEIDGLLNSINKARDARNEMIMNILLRMYSASNNVYPVRKKAGQSEVLTINQPSLTLYGTAIPQYYYEALSQRMLSNGFFARLLVLEAGQRGKGQEPGIVELPKTVTQTAAYWRDFNPGEISRQNLSQFDPHPIIVPAEEAARNQYRRIRAAADREYAQCQAAGDSVGMAVWARAYEKTRKLSLIYACSENSEHPVITQSAADWAWTFIEHHTQRMLFMAQEYVSENEFDANQKRVLRIIRDAGGKISQQILTRRTQFLNRRERQDILDNLIEAGNIAEHIIPTTGRPQKMIVLI